MGFVKVELKSNYDGCELHGTQFGSNDTYILVTVTAPVGKPFGIAQFQACNDNCASDYLFYWLAIGHTVAFQYSTPEIRQTIDKKVADDMKKKYSFTYHADASLS